MAGYSRRGIAPVRVAGGCSPVGPSGRQRRAGKITGEELEHLQEADYIARARGMTDGVERYVVVEAALTVDDRDVERARSRAATLERVTGVATLALVVGETVNAPQEGRAQELGVTLLLVDS